MRDLGHLQPNGAPEGRVRISDRSQSNVNPVRRQPFPSDAETTVDSVHLIEISPTPNEAGLFSSDLNGQVAPDEAETFFDRQFETHHAEWVPYLPDLEPADESHFLHCAELFPDFLTKFNKPLAKLSETVTCSEHDTVHTELVSYPIGLQEIPERPNLLIELNESFLAPGQLNQGIELPTGAVWRPSLWVFGTYRTGFNYLERTESSDVVEIAQRLDLFAQLNLSGTERVLLGLRPVDEETSSGRRFLSYDFQDGKVIDGWNADIQTLFFEGDFGELFPRLDPHDRHRFDIGFSVGRQPMSFQQGLLINEDRVDAVTATRNTISGNRLLNLRMTGVYVWDEIHRNNNQLDSDAQLVGLFTESDFALSTINADIAYLHSQSSFGSQLAFGLSAIQRLHGFHNTYNTSVHVLGSIPTDGETSASGRGVLLFSQTSWTPHHTVDLIYLNGFWAIDQFTSPMRGTLAGGPLGQTGILFAAPGLGRFGAPLSNQASDVVGGSLGYQLFFDHTKQQIIFEVGGRQPTNNVAAEFGFGTRYQKALDQHWILVIDGFASKQVGQHWTPGARIELLAKF
ncbi:hypothetical protein AB1L42_01655 [Thalassoglobus sp. JC818]|uniref:hypothetical protein n=1 Tax=Thalassoglobus sp. JC818 TaxID=3232136 RepID=UPI00345B277F